MRKTYVYRLKIRYPPKTWDGPEEFTGTWQDAEGKWRWPRERRFLSLKGAQHRAQLLQNHGCSVWIFRGEINWGGQDEG